MTAADSFQPRKPASSAVAAQLLLPVWLSGSHLGASAAPL